MVGSDPVNNGPPCRRVFLGICWFLAAWGGLPQWARGEARSIEAFVASRDKWAELVNTRWTLEGRYLGLNKTGLKFVNCDLSFVFVDPQPVPRPTSAVVEVTGRLEREDNKLIFKVESLRPRPDDLEIVRMKRAELDSLNADPWFRLAEWVQGRGTFYRDPKLLEEAEQLKLQGIRIEHRNLPKGDAAALSALIDKARKLPVAAELVRQLVHERLQIRSLELRGEKSQDDQFADLQVAIRKEFPSATAPLEGEFPEELNTRYLAQPAETFRNASPAEQDVLTRLLYVDVMTYRILRTAKSDGGNGLEIADRLRSEVPERADLAAKYERMGIDNQTGKVGLMTRSQMLALTEELRNRGYEEAIPNLKREWLLSREPSLRLQGALGLAQLGDSWLELLNDEESAIKFYLEAWRVDPDLKPIHDWLMARGYVLYDDQWILKDRLPANPKSRMERAVEEGRVEPGMTADQVRKAFGALPTSISRFASNGTITELWVYDGAGVAVRFTRRNRPEPSRVVSVQPLNAD